MAKKVGTLIKEARTEAGLTQEQLARKVKGVSASDISKAERGELIGIAQEPDEEGIGKVIDHGDHGSEDRRKHQLPYSRADAFFGKQIFALLHVFFLRIVFSPGSFMIQYKREKDIRLILHICLLSDMCMFSCRGFTYSLQEVC